MVRKKIKKYHRKCQVYQKIQMLIRVLRMMILLQLILIKSKKIGKKIDYVKINDNTYLTIVSLYNQKHLLPKGAAFMGFTLDICPYVSFFRSF